jgi:hypothetical protein
MRLVVSSLQGALKIYTSHSRSKHVLDSAISYKMIKCVHFVDRLFPSYKVRTHQQNIFYYNPKKIYIYTNFICFHFLRCQDFQN